MGRSLYTGVTSVYLGIPMTKPLHHPPSAMVRVDEGEATLIRLARQRLVRKGTERLDQLIAMCPKCGDPIEGVHLTSERWKCEKCGHAQKGINLDTDGGPALGSVAGVGIVALLRWLHEQDRAPGTAP